MQWTYLSLLKIISLSLGNFTLGNLILSSQWVIPEKSLGNLTMGIPILDNRALSNLTLSDYNRDNTTLGN